MEFGVITKCRKPRHENKLDAFCYLVRVGKLFCVIDIIQTCTVFTYVAVSAYFKVQLDNNTSIIVLTKKIHTNQFDTYVPNYC